MARRVGPSPALLRALIPCRENPTDPAARLVLADILESLDKGELARWVRRSLAQVPQFGVNFVENLLFF